jgi:integrase/recombinase XerC
METQNHSKVWNDMIRDWMSWLQAGGISTEGQKLRQYQLTRIAQELKHLDPMTVTSDNLADWMSPHDWSRETLRSYRSALRSFYGWAHASGRMDSDPARLLRKIPVPYAHPRPAAEVAIEQAIGKADARVYLMIMLGSRHGLRRAEISRVQTSDLLRDSSGWSLLVHGKGGKERAIPLLDEMAAAIREQPAGWVFPNGFGSHLTPAHIGVLLRRCLPQGTTPHQLRHRFASKAYQATHDIRAVQELLGHASVATTQRYTATAPDALRNAVRAASPTSF